MTEYNQKIMEYYNKTENVGSLDKTRLDVGTGLVGAPSCGDVMKLQIAVDEHTGIIKDVKFKTFGCVSAIASSNYLAKNIKGKTLAEVRRIRNSDIANELSLPPVKIHCSILAEDAIVAAIKDYESKKVSIQSDQESEEESEEDSDSDQELESEEDSDSDQELESEDESEQV